MKKNFAFLIVALLSAIGSSACLPFLEEDDGYGSCTYTMAQAGITISNCANFIGTSYMTTASSICGVLTGTFSETSCGDTDSTGNAKVGCCKQNAGTSQEVEYCSYGEALVASAAQEACEQPDENGNLGTWVAAE